MAKIKKTLKIAGMHCSSCEFLIERKLKKLEGVSNVKVSRKDGKAEMEIEDNISLEELQNAVKEDGYVLSELGDASQLNDKKKGSKYKEIAAAFVLIVAGYLLLKQFNLIPDIGVSDNMSYSFIFLLGLVAATSTCLAVTGGLLLATATKFNKDNPQLTRWQKFKPHIYFNIGRIISYAIFGGIIGLIGSMLALTPKVTGIIIVVASLTMVLLGLQILELLPWLNRMQLKMPKFFAHKILDASEGKTTNTKAFFLGGSTFFLPCGFTQALQLYVLSRGDFTTGMLTMLVFSLGTLPSLVSLGAVSSFAKGKFQRHFTTISAVLIIVIGLLNMPNGLALAGALDNSPYNGPDKNVVSIASINSVDDNVKIVNGKQIVEMKVVGYDYYPYKFKIIKGVPVEWVIDGTKAAGCAQVITAPKLGITEYLPRQGTKMISFTPKQEGFIPFSCTMGMTTRGAGFEVVSNSDKEYGSNNEGSAQLVAGSGSKYEKCDPNVMDCNIQKLEMEISREKGFYPNTFTVKKGIPVELNIDSKLQLGGCMSTMVIPKYGVAHYIPKGNSTLKFTPEEEGRFEFTCSMGSHIGDFIVTA